VEVAPSGFPGASVLETGRPGIEERVFSVPGVVVVPPTVGVVVVSPAVAVGDEAGAPVDDGDEAVADGVAVDDDVAAEDVDPAEAPDPALPPDDPLPLPAPALP
jgi:hypothetical protein